MPAHLPEVIAQDALECVFAKPGLCDNYPENWVHTKTCPFTIIALPVVGRYETMLDGVHSVCEAGEAFLVPANREVSITHRFDPVKRTMASRWLHAHWTLFGAVDFTSLLAMPPRLSRERTKPLWDLIEELLALEVRGGLASAARKRELAFRALRLLTEVAPLREEAPELLRGYGQLKPAIAYAREHLAGKVTVKQMARAAFLSPSRFHALFRAKTGSAPMRYVRELRIGEARRRLSATVDSVAEIAEATGFANQFHFSREFRRATGMTPSAYRRANSILIL